MPAVVTAPAKTAKADSGILDLLADWRIVALLGALCDGPLTRAELHGHAADLSDSTFDRKVKRLKDRGLIAGRQQSTRPYRCNSYALTRVGVDLLEVADVVEGWEMGACTSTRRHAKGALAKLIADPINGEILWALSEDELTRTLLERRLPGRARATLERRTSTLQEVGLIERRPAADHREARYALTVHGRRAGAAVVAAARWHWRWTPQHVPLLASDVPGLICLIAPLVHTSDEVEGTCLLHVEPMPAAPARPHVHLSVAGRRLTPLPLGSTRPLSARVHAATAACWEALWRGDPQRIVVEGDRALAQAVLAGLARALR